MEAAQRRYLDLMSQSFTTNDQISAEIIANKTARSNPKKAELFVSDIHGEYESFAYIVRSGCGKVRTCIDEAFQKNLTEDEKDALLTLVCYPEQKIKLELQATNNAALWLQENLHNATTLGKQAALNHSLADLQTALESTGDFAPSIEELLMRDNANARTALINAIIEANCGKTILAHLCALIQYLCIGKLHVVGDIYDRGPYPDLVMEELINYHNLDIQWGNHDIVWMGAALGQRGCIANVVRICARYGNLSILTDAYGINLLPLITFALDTYKDDPCVAFGLKGNPDISEGEREMNIKVQKAMAILQFKVEAQLIAENPSFGLESRNLLDKIDYKNNTVVVDGVEYALTDTVFPTVDPSNPYQLTKEEAEVMAHLESAFTSCEKLQRHIHLFLEKGSLYKIENNILMFHACVPLNDDGSLKEVNLFNKTYKGRALFDAVDRYVRDAYVESDPQAKKQGLDLLWYLWLGEGSPLFAKSKMATFELYLIAEKPARKEVKNAFYSLLENEEVFAGIFEDFGMDPASSHIVCGHVPVKVKDGEDPVKCKGKTIIIDGGFSRAYQPTTGIAGLTLISDSNGITLASHKPFIPVQEAIKTNTGVQSTLRTIEASSNPVLVSDTDEGTRLARRIEDLKQLLSIRK